LLIIIQKKTNFLDKDVDKLLELVTNQKKVLKEAYISISAGIYIIHSHNFIHGFDFHNWDNYVRDS